eukprot:792025-Amphidinium_carterae.1
MSKDSRNRIGVCKGSTASREVTMMSRAKRYRYIHTVWKKAVILTHIIATDPKECTIVYPDGLIVRVGPATSAASPVTW